MTSQTEEHIIKLKPGEYLGDVLNSLPAGRIFKRYTGIGATTVEIKDQSRNSIIVCPTRALAGGKALSEGIYYVGGEYPGITPSTTDEILESLSDDSTKTKVMVVADSLIRIYDELGEQKNAFFYMFDEIDSFQSESNYRPNLEKCLDIYFRIDARHRNMVSATMMDSLDTRIMEEPYSRIEIIDEVPPKTNVIYAKQSVIKTLKDRITSCFEGLTDDERILIGFNSLKGIMKTITIFPRDIQENTGVLCSDNSISELPEEYKTSLTDGKLVKKVTFMTSAYFAGVDVNEKCHVYAVSDTSYLFSLLLKAKIYQIFGRPRLGVESQTFIFSLNQKFYKDIDEYKGWLNRKVIKAKAAASVVLNLADNDMSEAERDETTHTISSIIKSTHIQSVELIRHDSGDILKNNLNLDYLFHRQRAMNLLYSDVVRTKEELSIVFDVVYEIDDTGLDDSELKLLDTLKADSHSKKQIRALSILEGPYGTGGYVAPKNDFERTLEKLMVTPPKGKVATSVKKLMREVIIEHNCHLGKLNTVYQSLLIYRLATLQASAKVLDNKFKANKSYTSEEIHLAFREMAELKTLAAFSDIMAKDIKKVKAVELFNKIFVTERSSRKEEGKPKTDAYKIYIKNIHFQPKKLRTV